MRPDLESDETKSSPPQATSPPVAREAELSRKAPNDNAVSRSNTQQRGTCPNSTAMLHTSPVQTSAAGPSQHGVSPRAIPEHSISNTSSQLNMYEGFVDTGYTPAFFDLNMNFDFLGEEPWMSPSTPGNASLSDSVPYQSDTPGSSSNTQEATVIIGPGDHRLIQHYLNVMTNFAKIRCSGEENIYSHIFSNMALFYPPLYNAIMAWTAMHLGQLRSEPDLVRKAEERCAHAISLTHRDQNVALNFELSIVTIWFVLQYEMLAAQGIESFCRHLEFTADLVDAHRRHQRAGGEATPLGRIGCRMLVWLGAYDCRASCIGGSGRLLRSLESFCAEYDFIDAVYPNVPPGTEDLKPALRLSLELDYMESRIVQLHRRSVTAPAAIWSTVQSGLITIRERFEKDPAIAPIMAYITNPSRQVASRITTRRFNCFVLIAAFYGVVISFHRMIPEPVAKSIPSKITSANDAATNIIRLASWAARFRPPSPQNVWPRLLFMAGIETTDLAHQDWVIRTLTEAEVWGPNFRKTRLLLERVIKIQTTEGVRADYLDVMKQSADMFVI